MSQRLPGADPLGAYPAASEAEARAGADAADRAASPAADDTHLREVTVRSDTVYRGHFLQVKQDQVRLPDGHIATREFITHPGAVMVVPLLDDGRLVVERQYRYPLRRSLIEFPAGKLDWGEAPFDCARRELNEETGYSASLWARAGVLNNAIAYSDEAIEIWFARGLTLGERSLDHGEFLDVMLMTSGELDEAARRGEITDAKTLIGLLWLQNWLMDRWPLTWFAAP
jgi:ADP-ribose pyrophosphatase